MITWKDVESNWSKYTPKIHTKWNKITETELGQVKGNRDSLRKKIETHYKLATPVATAQIDEFLKAQATTVKK